MPVLYPILHCCSMVWALPRSLATTYGITVVFSSCGYLDVSVPHVSLLYAMYLRTGTQGFTLSGFPHSDIHGSMAICASPWLFAAYHVLLRLLVPRHSPYALNSLTFSVAFHIYRCNSLSTIYGHTIHPAKRSSSLWKTHLCRLNYSFRCFFGPSWFSEFKVIVSDYCAAYNLHYSAVQQSFCKIIRFGFRLSFNLYHLRCFES